MCCCRTSLARPPRDDADCFPAASPTASATPTELDSVVAALSDELKPTIEAGETADDKGEDEEDGGGEGALRRFHMSISVVVFPVVFAVVFAVVVAAVVVALSAPFVCVFGFDVDVDVDLASVDLPFDCAFDFSLGGDRAGGD